MTIDELSNAQLFENLTGSSLNNVATMLQIPFDGEIGSLEQASSLIRVFSPQETSQGSFSFPLGKNKIIVMTMSSEEVSNVKALSILGIKCLPLNRRISTTGNDPDYYIGKLPANSLNLGLFKFRDTKQDVPYYGDFDILRNIAEILANIHNAGYTHNGFTVDNLALVPNTEDPLLLIRNDKLEKQTNPEQKNKDIDDFLSSLKSLCDETDFSRFSEFFIQAYRSLLTE